MFTQRSVLALTICAALLLPTQGVLGANDSDLNARQADYESLLNAGCNVQGQAQP